jgi:hypothetical protein
MLPCLKHIRPTISILCSSGWVNRTNILTANNNLRQSNFAWNFSYGALYKWIRNNRFAKNFLELSYTPSHQHTRRALTNFRHFQHSFFFCIFIKDLDTSTLYTRYSGDLLVLWRTAFKLYLKTNQENMYVLRAIFNNSKW